MILTFKINRVLFYGIVLSPKWKLFSETSFLGKSSSLGVFLLSVLGPLFWLAY